MARPSELENRVLAILDDRRSRHSVGRRVARLGLVGFGLVVLTVASIRPTAAATEGAGFDATLEGERATTGEPVPIPRAVTDPAAEGPAVETVTDPEAAGETGFADGAPPIEPPSVGPLPQEAASDTIEERVLAALTRALRSEDPRVRRQAANTLGAIESPRAVEALASVVRSDDTPAVRREAAWALGMIESADAVDALAAAVRDTDGGVREKAVWALGMIESEAGVPALAAAAGDADPDVRAQVAWAIGMIEARSGVEPLLALLEDPESDVRDQAAWGLGMIESADAVAGLNRAFAAEADADVRAQILWALGMIEDRGGIDTVIDGLEDDDPDVREKALWALGMIMS